MEYILTQIFGQTARTAGPLIGLLVTLAFGLIAVALYRAKKTIDLDDRKEQLRDQERQAELQSRANERQALVQELRESRIQINTFLTNHLAHLKEEADKRVQIEQATALTLQKACQTLEALSVKVESHSQESRSSFSKLYEKLENVKDAVRK